MLRSPILLKRPPTRYPPSKYIVEYTELFNWPESLINGSTFPSELNIASLLDCIPLILLKSPPIKKPLLLLSID